MVATYAGSIRTYTIIADVPSLSPTTAPPTEPPIETELPTVAPTTLPTLTVEPTTTPTTHTPSQLPTVNYYQTSLLCPSYAASNTGSAIQNTVPCSFLLCPYDTVSISLCAGTCTSDPFIRLYDSSLTEVASNDDSCGLCSALSFSYSKSTVSCEEYTLQQGCFSNSACSSQATITITASTEVVKYTFAVYFVNDNSTVSVDQGVLVSYHYNQKTSENLHCTCCCSSLTLIFPFSQRRPFPSLAWSTEFTL